MCDCAVESFFTYDKRENPEAFNALCDTNRLMNEADIQESYQKLVEAGVPEKYIFVIQANRDDNLKRGDLFSYSNKARLEETLSCIKESASICCSPDVFIFLCVDVRDQEAMAKYLNRAYFQENWFKEMIAKYCDLWHLLIA